METFHWAKNNTRKSHKRDKRNQARILRTTNETLFTLIVTPEHNAQNHNEKA